MQNFETLENLGKKLKVTRERIRQNERDINKALIKIGKIDKYSIVEFFNKYNSISFHKLFPLLDKNFTNTSHSNSGGDITRDRLVVFMENYCGVKENYFTTPERELWNFNSEKLKQIFEFTSSGVSNDNFIEVIEDLKMVDASLFDLFWCCSLVYIFRLQICPESQSFFYSCYFFFIHLFTACRNGTTAHSYNSF